MLSLRKNTVNESPTAKEKNDKNEAMIIIFIALESLQNSYLKKFVKSLLTIFILEELVIIAEVCAIYINLSDEWTAIIWRIYEIIRIFISISLCYPKSLFTGESEQKLQHLFLIVCGLVGIGAILDHLKYNNGNTGMNLIVFLLIFLFTYYQYIQLHCRIEEKTPRLKSLMAIALTLILLTGLLVILFFTGICQSKVMSAIRIIIWILQYHKLYMMI
jgi:hypothetical protein